MTSYLRPLKVQFEVGPEAVMYELELTLLSRPAVLARTVK